MVVVAAARSSPAGRLCTSPSTIIPDSPFPACSPTSKAKPPSPFCATRLPSTPNTVSPSAACSPTTAPAIVPDNSAPLASNSASSTASPVPTLPAPTARRNASSKPPCANGPTFAITSTLRNAISSSRPGYSITTSIARMVVSVTLRPSAARLRWVQRLDRSQAPMRVSNGLTTALQQNPYYSGNFISPVTIKLPFVVWALVRGCPPPIETPYFPAAIIGSPLVETILKSRGCSSNVTDLLSPGSRWTRSNPRSAMCGAPSTLGNVRYSCATSSPPLLPAFLTVTSACNGSPALMGAAGNFRSLYANVV